MTTALTVDVQVMRPGFVVDVDISVPGSSTLALLGPNGAGKSTLVSAIAGALPLAAGTITLGDRILDDTVHRIHLHPEDRRIGLMFQDHLLFPHLSVLDNVSFAARSQGRGRSSSRELAQEWLDRMGLGDLAGRRPGQLSGGQAQRVALARTLASDPVALLLDEPLAALDVATRAETRRLVSEHLETFSGPRLLITHDPTEAFSMADTVAIMEGGRIVQAGTSEEIRRAPRTPYAADLAGINLIRGVARDGIVTTDDGVEVVVADRSMTGQVLATVHPRAVAIHDAKPHGSPRNVWETTVVAVDRHGDQVRVATGPPMPITAEITAGSVERLGLQRGIPVWVAVKASEITVEPV